MYSSRSSRNSTITASRVIAFSLLFFFINLLCRAVISDSTQVHCTSQTAQLPLSVQQAFPKENLFETWRTNPETCSQWIASQRSSRAYVDAYIIGAQKTSTSEMSTRLYKLGILHRQMKKEWQYFNRLRDPGAPAYRELELHRPYTHADIQSIRLPHYLSGFPHHTNVTKDEHVPQIDNSPPATRKVIYDATVEYMLSDRIALLASLLNPHARILMSMREPISRALSQYNMLVRTRNAHADVQGDPKITASADEFDSFVRHEIDRLRLCGYNQATGSLDRTTSMLLACMFPEDPKDYSRADKLYVTRGIYHIHIETWKRFFPAHRMHFIRFGDVSSGNGDIMQNIAKFLCVRPYPETLLKEYKDKASNVSYGVQAAEMGLDKWRGFDSYGGSNKYLTEIHESTRKTLEDFYAPSNKRLFALMGKEIY